MLERRVIRVAMPYSRTLFFIDKGRERGIAAENMRDFERWLNKKHAKEIGKRPLTIVLIPITRDKLLPNVNDGLADVAAGNITVTDERRKLVDFALPTDARKGRELVVTGLKAPRIESLDDLSGQTVHVRPSTSYAESVGALNKKLVAAGKAPMKIAQLPAALEDEDKLEMLNAGLIDIGVIDDWKGRIWAQVLPNIKVHDKLVLRDDAVTGWAIRKSSPKLAAEITDFYAHYLKQQGVLDARVAQYFKNIRQISDSESEEKRFTDAIALFRKYGAQYRFDPLMLAAQGYQESQLNQNAKSRVGAIGVMQVMPATGKELNVGDIRSIDPNIHAGTKYMDQLMTRYFPDAKFDESGAVRFRRLQLRPGQYAKDAQGGGRAWPRPRPVVQQRRGGHRREDRSRDDDLRAQHLQILRRLQAARRCARRNRGDTTAGLATADEVMA